MALHPKALILPKGLDPAYGAVVDTQTAIPPK